MFAEQRAQRSAQAEPAVFVCCNRPQSGVTRARRLIQDPRVIFGPAPSPWRLWRSRTGKLLDFGEVSSSHGVAIRVEVRNAA